LPPELRDRAARWPRIEADTIDLAVRTKSGGRFPSLKMVAANLNVVNLAELPYDPTKPVTNTQWEEIKQYNEKDLAATKLVLEHFTPELEAISALSARYDIDLRSVHQAGIASQILCAAYRDRYGRDPVKVASPASVQYRPPGPVVRPRNEVAAAWFDRITSESFPLVVPKGGENPKPVVPEPGTPIVVGGIELNVGSGGLHSVDRPALHRSDAGHAIYEADVASYYPSMMAQFGIFPRALGEVGLEQYREILAERLEIKERVLEATEPEEERYFKRQSAGLKIVLNSLFGQLGNPYSVLYDPEAFLAVTLTGQLMLIDLVERLDSAGAILLSVNTDGLTLKVRRDDDRWPKVLDAWESDTGMVLETVPVEALMIEATNHYGVRYADGKTKRRGNLSDAVDWRHVPHHQVVADAVVAALFDGVLPEHSVRRCARPAEFVGVTRRDSSKVGVLVNDATGEETPSPRLVRWYKAKDSQFRIEHRWTDKAGKAHKSTPPGTSGVQLLMDLPEPGHPLGDVDYGWYVGEARARILANRDFNHLDPKWLSGIAADLYARGLAPSPHWAGKKSPRGAKRDRPSYFWEWSRYHTFGTYTGPEVGVLALDIDEPAKFHKWIEAPLWDPRDLGDCLVSYHRCDSPGAVRAGEAKGKLLFQFKADADHPLAKVGKAAFRSTLGIEIFYGHGDPSVLGEHPDGPEAEYLLDGILGSPPDWLIADLVERASKKVRAPKEKVPGGNGKPADSAAVANYAKAALEKEVCQVAAAAEGSRNSTLWKASCALGSLAGAGALDRAEAEEKLQEATTLPEDEAVDVIRRGLDRGAEVPRDLDHVGKNGDGVPMIEITVAEHEVNDQAVAALAADPDLYQRGHLLNRVLREPPRPDDMVLGRDPGGLTIVPIHAATLRERLTKYACWVKRKKGDDGDTVVVPAHPPDWSVQAVAN
ncbi:MAG TPA: DNA polymerase domain-containing protein, partial [Isosphaeraceae bacterium]|nr:DNA polymerase domain-containing protein [Isosphaeraceae bacterium]